MAKTKYLTILRLTTLEIRRLFSRIDVSTTSGCWIWRGTSLSVGGYGRIRHHGRHELVHRVLYAWLVEPLPRGRGPAMPVLDHFVCDFPPCCNPAHLRLVSNKANCLRATHGPIIENAKREYCVHGHLLPRTPNDRKGRKRYCLRCAIDYAAARRHNPKFRPSILEYHRQYSIALRNSPRRDEVLARERNAMRRYRDRQRAKGTP